MADTRRCTRVTGYAFEPSYGLLPPERQGPKREKKELIPGRVGSPAHRLAEAYDVLCGYSATYWVKKEGVTDPVYCCTRCLSAVVDEQGPTVMVGVLKQCPETDKFGGQCAYALNHNPEMNHRFLGGDEDARHEAALAAYHEERKA